MAQGENQDPYKSQVSSMNTGRPRQDQASRDQRSIQNFNKDWVSRGRPLATIGEPAYTNAGYTVGPYGAMPYNKGQTPYVVTPYGASVIRTQGQDLVRTGNNTYAPSYVINRPTVPTTESGGGGGGGVRRASNLSATAGSVLPALDPQTAFALRQLAIQANRDYGFSELDAQNALVNAYLSSSEAARTGRRGVTGGYLDDLDVMAETGGVDMTSPAIGGVMTQDYLNNLAQFAIRENMDQAQAEQDRAIAELSNFQALRNAILDINSAGTAARMQAGVSETGSAKPMPVAKKTKKKKVK